VGSEMCIRDRVPLAALAFVAVVVEQRLRLPVVVLGGVLTLSSSGSLDVPKIAYLVFVAVASVTAAARWLGLTNSPAFRFGKPMILASVLFGGVVCASIFTALYNTTPVTDWLRDASPYLLLTLAPLIAFDTQPTLSRAPIAGLLVVSGLLAAASFSIAFLAARQLADLPIVQLPIPSGGLAIALFSYATAHAIHARNDRTFWAVIATIVITILVVTGTRTYLVLLATPVVVVLSKRDHIVRQSMRLAGYGLVSALLLILGLISAGYLLRVDLSVVLTRFTTAADFLANGVDPSYVDRQTASRAALEAFLASPIFGTGPGHVFVWQQVFAGTVIRYNIDTFLTFPAKFGLIGLAALAVLLGGTFRVVRRLGSGQESAVLRAALASFLLTTTAFGFLGNPLEDKGFSLGLMLLLALVAAYATSSSARSDSNSSRGINLTRDDFSRT